MDEWQKIHLIFQLNKSTYKSILFFLKSFGKNHFFKKKMSKFKCNKSGSQNNNNKQEFAYLGIFAII